MNPRPSQRNPGIKSQAVAAKSKHSETIFIAEYGKKFKEKLCFNKFSNLSKRERKMIYKVTNLNLNKADRPK